MTKTILAVTVALLWVGTAHAAGTQQQKCQQAKLKAQGRYQACVKKNTAGMVVGKDDLSATCLTKFQAALTKADTKAAAKMTSCRYIDNGDGSVSDLNTGLVWDKKTNLDSAANPADPHDSDNGYAWASSGVTPNGTAFTSFLGALNGETSSDGSNIATACFTGHCDWRLPTIQELKAIVELSVPGCGFGSPCIDPAFGSTTPGSFFSATTDSSNPSNAWLVDFFDGVALPNFKGLGSNVRAVRGGL